MEPVNDVAEFTLTNVAVVLAGGAGNRFGAEKPKQFLQVGRMSILERSVSAFESHPAIDEIAVVVHPDYLAEVSRMVSSNGWHKVKQLLPGGHERYESSLAALRAYDHAKVRNMLFHDAARPLVSARIISDVLNALQNHEAVDVAVPVTDTILQTDSTGEFINAVPDRNQLRASQTPQAFRFSVIQEAYSRALASGPLTTTDDCGVLLRYMPEIPVFIVPGDEANFKVTYPSDVVRLKQYLAE
ncbi:MAG: 2-C-methyl-D-erythritol 4-phosphate cytidylyltransferase [Bacteroidales bacterium]|nr:2-C-methyl-D-erythritol 4-phosphate cytidylyltransferase [Bacteroidales bacterium]